MFSQCSTYCCTPSLAVIVLALTDEQPAIPDSVIQDMVFETTSEHNIVPLSGKRLLSSLKDPRPRKKKKQIQYDWERAQRCVQNDWIAKFPISQTNLLKALSESSMAW